MGWYFHHSGASRSKDTIFLETLSPDFYMPAAFPDILFGFQQKDIRCSLAHKY